MYTDRGEYLLGKPSELPEHGCYEMRLLPSEGLPGVALLLLTKGLFLSLLYATRMMFLEFNHILVPSCLGVLFCIVKCFEGLLISNSMGLVLLSLDYKDFSFVLYYVGDW